MHRLSVAGCLFSALCGTVCCGAERLPLPEPKLPEPPPFPPSVVTAGGQRLLLGDARVGARYDVAACRLLVTPAETWLINYPLMRITGFGTASLDERSRTLFGLPFDQVRNWYVKTPGTALSEPRAPTGPAPVEPSRGPATVVDCEAANASDQNPGTVDAPLKTISAAVRALGPERPLVRVHPGIYRESVAVENSGGLANRPLLIEGVREDGRMPVVSGNDPFPAGAWAAVPEYPGVFRGAIFTGRMGTVSADGKTLREASWPDRLQPGEFCFNRASVEFLRRRASDAHLPRTGLEERGKVWRTAEADEDGFIHLGDDAGSAVTWGSAWIWVPPRKRDEGVVWDPRFPEPVSGKLACGGEFRAFRMTGTGMGSQVNKYRLWANGELLPSAFVPGQPRPRHNYGTSDGWEGVTLREGWNHLLFQFDTTARPDKLRFRFGLPKGVKHVHCSAEAPRDSARQPQGEPTGFVSKWLLLGPFPATADRGVYVRLAGDVDPSTVLMDLAKRNLLVDLKSAFVHFRGFELRHGAQFQQRAQLSVEGEGCLVEGCLMRDSEVRGISVKLGGLDQRRAPIALRGNWVVDPGGLGVGASGSSDRLTPENQDGVAPGRGRLLCEYNTVVNNNCHGYARFWESGGFKMFRLTGAVLRNNTFIGGDGPAIWLDWEHYNNRVEGNLSLNGIAFCVGVEASPGANLVANNLSVNLRPGGVWFRHGVLAWSSHGVWAVHNTVDGRWNDMPTWQGKTGADGIYLHEGNPDRKTRWGAVPKRQALVGNVVIGCDAPLRRWGWNPESLEVDNVSDTRKGKWPLDGTGGLRAPGRLDYRPVAGRLDPVSDAGREVTQFVRHDFYGLLRFPDLPQVPGACREDPVPVADPAALIEVELHDGTMRRLHDVAARK